MGISCRQRHLVGGKDSEGSRAMAVCKSSSVDLCADVAMTDPVLVSISEVLVWGCMHCARRL